jgi:phage-related protein
MSTFTWLPMPGGVQTKRPRVITSQFGDGYQQRIGDGINTNPRSWSLRFTRLTADIDAIEAFLDARKGTESFVWVPPRGLTGKWICAEWSSIEHTDKVQEIFATFNEVFE